MSVNLSFRPRFGFECEGNALIQVVGNLVVIDYYVWKGSVLEEAKTIAKALVDDNLETFEKDKSSYGNGHGRAVYRIGKL